MIASSSKNDRGEMIIMLINSEDIKYLARIDEMIAQGKPIIRKSEDVLGGKIDSRMMFCPECDEEIDDWYEGHLIMRDSNDDRFIAIACEGYHPIDIA
jgi:hypothetical protein